MRVLVLVTENTTEAATERLLDWVQKASKKKGAATLEVIQVGEADNPSELVEGADVAYAVSNVADVIKTSAAIADWGRNWRLHGTTAILMFVLEKQQSVVPRRIKNSTRRPAYVSDGADHLNGNLADPLEP